ncbi:MAG: FkbM family methyltransferase [Bacteroidales bacterium]
MGYYTKYFCKRAGKSGRVISVEPVKVYRDILRLNTRRCSSIEILPFALGNGNGTASMEIPSEDITRHGLTRITDSAGTGESSWTVEVRDTEETFSNLAALDYIKCDIEGYENRVIPGLYRVIEREKPVIQVELARENFNEINNHLISMGYTPYQARKKRLVKVEEKSNIENDVIYLTEQLSLRFKNIIDLSSI